MQIVFTIHYDYFSDIAILAIETRQLNHAT